MHLTLTTRTHRSDRPIHVSFTHSAPNAMIIEVITDKGDVYRHEAYPIQFSDLPESLESLKFEEDFVDGFVVCVDGTQDSWAFAPPIPFAKNLYDHIIVATTNVKKHAEDLRATKEKLRLVPN